MRPKQVRAVRKRAPTTPGDSQPMACAERRDKPTTTKHKRPQLTSAHSRATAQTIATPTSNASKANKASKTKAQEAPPSLPIPRQPSKRDHTTKKKERTNKKGQKKRRRPGPLFVSFGEISCSIGSARFWVCDRKRTGFKSAVLLMKPRTTASLIMGVHTRSSFAKPLAGSSFTNSCPTSILTTQPKDQRPPEYLRAIVSD